MRLDILTAWRQLRRAPGTAVAAIATLAVGIGATTAVFSFVAAVMSAASPAPDMEGVVAVWSHNRNESETKGLVSPADFLDWGRRATSFDAVAAWRGTQINVSGTTTAVRTDAMVVTPSYLQIFDWRPMLGRPFTDQDALSGAPRTAIASYPFWQNTLNGRPDVIGHTIRLDGAPATIIGVLPRLPALTGLLLPLSLDAQQSERSARTLFVFARLRSSVSIEAARAEMESIGQTLERDFPDTNRGWSVNTRPAQEEFVGPQARLVFALLVGLVTAVLLIGCVNVANLLLARGASRRGELAVRLALGAGGWRVARQLLIECAVLAVLGGVLSLVVSRWTLNLLMTLGPIDSPWVANRGINPRALLLTALASLAATVLAGLAPALSARRANLVSGLHDSGRSGGRGTRRTTRILVTAQVGMAVALLVVAGLATRTLIALERLEPGFEMENVLTASVTLPDSMPPDVAHRWIEESIDRARRLPGVIAAGATSRLPFAGGRWNANRGLEIEGQSATTSEGRWAVDYLISPGLFESLRVPLVDGRLFAPSDGAETQPVAIVNQAMARRFWPNRSPIGERLRQGGTDSVWRTVVGVVADIRNDDADQPPLPYLYVPLAQEPIRTVSIAIRTANDPARLADPLRQAIAAFDPDQPLYDVRTMVDLWAADLQGSRILIQVMSALALIALGLAGLGVWGVAAQAVGQRTREIGVRVALGASAAQVGRLIAWQGFVPIAIGLAIGLVVGLGLGRVMRSILFQVTPTDSLTLAGTLALLALVGLAATLGPALRAARLDPLAALRTE
jgi:putative ABC transport system permease protein